MRLPLALALALASSTHAVLAAEAPDEPVAPTTVLVTADKFENGYAVDAASVAKGSASLRETPQSVSVVNRQRLNDQNLRTLDEALANITGLVVEQGSSHERRFYSRGFEIDTIQYDGVATQRGSGFNISPDLSVFERVEVLRGPAGLFNGSGSPGGAVNLVRKRPLKTNQVEALASAGRWDNYRAQVDANRVLNDSGSLRARVVGAYEDREFFYDVSESPVRHRRGRPGAVDHGRRGHPPRGKRPYAVLWRPAALRRWRGPGPAAFDLYERRLVGHRDRLDHRHRRPEPSLQRRLEAARGLQPHARGQP